MTSAELCVILLNYANWKDTVECLESLARLDTEPAVVVVDTGSEDDSIARIHRWVESAIDARPASAAWRRLPAREARRPAEIVRAPAPGASRALAPLPAFAEALTLAASPRRVGFAEGCNIGLRLALADPGIRYLWLLNNDAIVAPDAARHLIERARAVGSELGALGTVIAEYDPPDKIQMLGGGRVRRLSAEARFPAHGEPVAEAGALVATIGELDYISGASLFTTVDAVRAVGLLDETMHLYWEDTDWCARARAAGRRLEVCAEAVIWHKGHASTGGINRYTKFHHFRSAAIYLRRHRRAWPLPLGVRLAKSLARDALGGRPRDAVAAVRGLAAGLRVPSPGGALPVRDPDA